MGPSRNKLSIKYMCCIINDLGRECGAEITLYAPGEGKAETTSNAFNHMRSAAKKDAAHKAVIKELDAQNKNMVTNKDGERVQKMNFKEAFKHHVDYVYCRAAGILGASTGRKKEFQDYVRGALHLA